MVIASSPLSSIDPTTLAAMASMYYTVTLSATTPIVMPSTATLTSHSPIVAPTSLVPTPLRAQPAETALHRSSQKK